MKRHFCLSVLILLLLALVPPAHAGFCTLNTLTGSYAVATLGQTAGNPGVTLFLVNFDGFGNLSGHGAENNNGIPSTGVTTAGTYFVNIDCSFTTTATDSLGNTVSTAGNVTGNGAVIIGLSTSAGTALQFTAYKQRKTACAGPTSGSVVQQVQTPLTPYGPELSIAQETITSKGTYTGSWVANFSGDVYTGTNTGTEVVNSDCTYTATTTESTGRVFHYFGVKGLQQDGVMSMSMLVDSGWVRLNTSLLKWY